MIQANERSGLLGIFLLCLLGLFGWSAVEFLVLGGKFGAPSPAFPRWAVLCLGAISLLGFMATVSIWFWSKTGVIVYLLLTFLSVQIGLELGAQPALLGFLGPAMLLVLVSPYWDRMVWLPLGTMLR